MIVIENMSLQHVDDITDIENLCFSVPWSKESFIKEATGNSMAVYYVAVDKLLNKVVGFAGLWHIFDEGHITNVAVRPDYRRNGIASQLIKSLIDYSLVNKVVSLTLEVRESNESAIELYKKFDFRQMGKRKNYYKKPKEDAIIMWKNL